MATKYVVRLQGSPDMWIARWTGHTRATSLVDARRYATKRGALIGLGMARMWGGRLPDAVVEEVVNAG